MKYAIILNGLCKHYIYFICILKNKIHTFSSLIFYVGDVIIPQFTGFTGLQDSLASAASARSSYRVHLDQQTAKKITNVQAQKWKALEENIEDLKKKMRILVQVSMRLQGDADQLAEEAEGKAGTLMAQLATKLNTLRKRYKEKNM